MTAPRDEHAEELSGLREAFAIGQRTLEVAVRQAGEWREVAEELAAALRDAEYSDNSAGEYTPNCPACDSWAAHRKDCALAAALARLSDDAAELREQLHQAKNGLAAVTADANAAIMALQRELDTLRRERDNSLGVEG